MHAEHGERSREHLPPAHDQNPETRLARDVARFRRVGIGFVDVAFYDRSSFVLHPCPTSRSTTEPSTSRCAVESVYIVRIEVVQSRRRRWKRDPIRQELR